jgi:metal-responsive CopG/Arc/MetJ family transcriptional regulator
MNKAKVLTSKGLTFTCTPELLAVIDAEVAERQVGVPSRARFVRNALIDYLNLTMLERRELELDDGLVRNGKCCVSLHLPDIAVRERLDKVAERDRMQVSEVLRRAVCFVTK